VLAALWGIGLFVALALVFYQAYLEFAHAWLCGDSAGPSSDACRNAAPAWPKFLSLTILVALLVMTFVVVVYMVRRGPTPRPPT
jgi:hypothetical protein